MRGQKGGGNRHFAPPQPSAVVAASLPIGGERHCDQLAQQTVDVAQQGFASQRAPILKQGIEVDEDGRKQRAHPAR